MCGIAGILSFDAELSVPRARASVSAMTELMARRGPDDDGEWQDPEGRLHLGFRRLSIIDLTVCGRQPMVSNSGNSVLVYNGELYNFLDLREELAERGVYVRSSGDTAVLLEALELWGEELLPRLNGMFAFAFFDRVKRQLLLARDHAGIKPLYVFEPPGRRGVAFASQYNALLHTPWGRPGPMREDVLRLYLRLHHVPPPYGLLENTWQVQPGEAVRVDATTKRVTRRFWWRLPEAAPHTDVDAAEAPELLAHALHRAVRRQRVADVPVGVFLSGGIDSPLVAAIARAQHGRGLRAFTIGAPGWSQDETEDARRIARHLDLVSYEKAVDPAGMADFLPDAIGALHEPFGDFSLLPTLCVSRLAVDHVAVALSGDGGDELFFGYERPVSLLRSGDAFRRPRWARRLRYLAGRLGLAAPCSDTIVHADPGAYYLAVNARCSDAELARLAPDLAPLPRDFDLYRAPGDVSSLDGLAHASRLYEYYGQLQRTLKKVDMASMHNSLEVRVPLLDREIVELSLRIPPAVHLGMTSTDVRSRPLRRKALLTDQLTRHVPREALSTAKRGFSVPLAKWLRGPLRQVARETLLDGPTWPDGLFARPALERLLDEHQSGRRDAKWTLWTLMTLQWWARHHIPTYTEPASRPQQLPAVAVP